jgi:hypothetical protein
MLLLRLLPSREAGRNDRKPLDIEIEAQCSSSWYARKDPDNAIERHLSRKIAGPALSHKSASCPRETRTT